MPGQVDDGGAEVFGGGKALAEQACLLDGVDKPVGDDLAGGDVVGVVRMTAGSSAQFSLIWEGNSTQSRGTFVPEKLGYFTSERSPWRAWPNSWNKVVTSSMVKSGVEPSVGLVMLNTLTTTGFSPVRWAWSLKLLIHAPPRFSGRAK